MLKAKRIIAFAPHTDDIELGCGGSLSRLLETGAEVYYYAFSICEEWVPEPFPNNILRHEATRAAETIGISKERIRILDFRATEMWRHREEIYNVMEEARNEIQPDLIFTPCLGDTHQDHACIAVEAARAFKRSSTHLGYEISWNNLTFTKNMYIKLEAKHLEQKLKALNCYDSQKNKEYIDESFIRSLARVHGTEISTEFAECFELIRAVV